MLEINPKNRITIEEILKMLYRDEKGKFGIFELQPMSKTK
jgi:hypothetical protein